MYINSQQIVKRIKNLKQQLAMSTNERQMDTIENKIAVNEAILVGMKSKLKHWRLKC